MPAGDFSLTKASLGSQASVKSWVLYARASVLDHPCSAFIQDTRLKRNPCSLSSRLCACVLVAIVFDMGWCPCKCTNQCHTKEKRQVPLPNTENKGKWTLKWSIIYKRKSSRTLSTLIYIFLPLLSLCCCFCIFSCFPELGKLDEFTNGSRDWT